MTSPYDPLPDGPPAWLSAAAVCVAVVLLILILNAIFGGSGP